MSRRLAAILVADIVGYSRLMGLDEAGTVRRIKVLRREVIDPAVKSMNGRIVKTMGDGVLIEFPSPNRAVNFAVALQKVMGDRDTHIQDELRFKLRIGINLGDVIAQPDGDLYGDGVNVAARLEPLSEPGGLCISRSIHDQVRDRLPFQFEDRGKLTLKNIARPIGVFSLSATHVQSISVPTEDEGDDEFDATKQDAHNLLVVPAGNMLAGREISLLRKRLVLITVSLSAIMLGLIAGYLVIPSDRSGRMPAQSRPVVAVLNFNDYSNDRTSKDFIDGLTEETIAKMSLFREITVLSRSISSELSKAPEIGKAAKQIGVDFFLEGSYRRAANSLRITVQLIKAEDGAHVWANTYEREISSSTSMSIESEVAAKIGSEVGGWSGAIANYELRSTQAVDAEKLPAYACFAQANQAAQRQIVTAATVRARTCLEALVARDPSSAEGWGWLSTVLSSQRNWGTGLPGEEATDINKRAYLVPRAIAAAARAVDLAPADELPHFTLARAFYLSCNGDQLFLETQRTLSINPNDLNAMGTLGTLLAWTGRWETGLAYADKALSLAGPTAPRWWWWVSAKDHWRKGEYEEALQSFQRSYVEQNWVSHLHMAYTLPFLGRISDAQKHVSILRDLKPSFTIRDADAYYTMWCFDAAYRTKMAEALRMAGLPE